jgi:hypothetical protein
MLDSVQATGDETHLVVDGQQRIRSCLDFLDGKFRLDGAEIENRHRGLYFEDLTSDEKQTIFRYKFVVRILPEMAHDELRKIFARLNRNVVALNDQELRNATYWGPFIKTIQKISDEIAFWGDSGVFSANDHRRMIDQEFISELAIALLHGTQNKKDKLDYYYRLFEEEFEAENDMFQSFSRITAEIEQILPDLRRTRRKKRSDFYTLFLVIAERKAELPFDRQTRATLSTRLKQFAEKVDQLVRIEEKNWKDVNLSLVNYAKSVQRAASDRSNRASRANALMQFFFQ